MKTNKWIDKLKQWVSNPLAYNIIASIIATTVAILVIIALKTNTRIDCMEERLNSMSETQKIQEDNIESIRNEIVNMQDDISEIEKSIETMIETQRNMEEAINKRFEKIECFLSRENGF